MMLIIKKLRSFLLWARWRHRFNPWVGKITWRRDCIYPGWWHWPSMLIAKKYFLVNAVCLVCRILVHGVHGIIIIVKGSG